MYTENELFFPHHIIPDLRDMRGPKWAALVDEISGLPECHEKTLAFMWMMVNLNGCTACETDSYRAMKGCLACSSQTLRRHKASDDELIAQYEAALITVREFAQNHNSTRLFVQRATQQRPQNATPTR